MRFSLDYPGVNCRQCGENYRDDTVEPECDGCPVADWDTDTKMLFVVYDRVCPFGELDSYAFKNAFIDLEIPFFKRRMLRRNLVAMHREIKKYHAEKQAQDKQ